jgi:hypothetical protein
MISPFHPLVVFAVGVFLYYRPMTEGLGFSTLPGLTQVPGHIANLFRAKEWKEDPQFFQKRY